VSDATIIELRPGMFAEAEAVLATSGGLTASTFRYRSGVPALRLRHALGQICLLPYHGQQIWDAEFLGRRLTMRSIFPEPRPTRDYLANYGAFFIHCGATAMGNPGPADRHPLHGELPNACYERAQLVVGAEGGKAFMALTGTYRHRVALSHHYVAQPTVRLADGSARVAVDLSIRNLRHAPMELMYLAHINFRPVDGAVIVDGVPDDADHVRIRRELPPQFVPSREHLALLEAVTGDPGSHRRIDPGRKIDPELVMTLTCRPDEAGWAHAMQIHPDGAADFVRHRPDQLPHAVRWMSRTGDEDALGLVLPATAGPDGYTAEKARGHLRVLAPQEEFRCAVEFGALTADEAALMRKHIEATVRT
jgi:hypothetical protein